MKHLIAALFMLATTALSAQSLQSIELSIPAVEITAQKPIWYEVKFCYVVRKDVERTAKFYNGQIFSHFNIDSVSIKTPDVQEIKWINTNVDITKYNIYKDAEAIIGGFLDEGEEWEGLMSAYYIKRVYPKIEK